MKKVIKFPLFLLFTALFSVGVVSCSDDDDPNTEDLTQKEKALEPIVTQYVNNTVVATYKELADLTIELRKALITLRAEKTDENVVKAANLWKEARSVWELSEAFLFGPADILGIDPHIDTWPLVETEFWKVVNDAELIAQIDKDESVWKGENEEESVLGFHGLEFILFKAGEIKKASEISDAELVYAKVVSADLRNQCIRLEAGWATPSKVTAEKQEIIEKNSLVLLNAEMVEYYGEAMLNAGEGSVTYKTNTAAALAILDGCMVISDEVGNMKMGQPYRGEDINYIESPYSYNSKKDFADNIRSIQNAYLGGADKNNRGASISEYIKGIDPEVDTKIKAAAEKAISKIDAIPFPFVKNYTSTQTGEAIEACLELTKALQEGVLVVQ